MRKLALKLDELQVESFRTSPGEQPVQGTVRGHQEGDSEYYCPTTSCPTQFGNTCQGTCDGPTCGGQVCIPLTVGGIGGW
jgi:hypothetical protein